MDHSIDLLNKYCNRFLTELEESYYKIEKAATMPAQDLEIIDMLLHSLKSTLTSIEKLEGRDMEERYSGHYPTVHYPSDYSGRTRDTMGRYSGNSDKADMINNLEMKLRNARSEDEAKTLRDAIDAVSRLR